MKLLTGFHAIEEKIRVVSENPRTASNFEIFYNTPGPRVKKIIQNALGCNIKCNLVEKKILDKLVLHLPETSREHRGIILQIQDEEQVSSNIIDFDEWLSSYKAITQNNTKKRCVVLMLDSVTDPHNVGAILRSADQFGIDLVIMPARHSANDITKNDIIARASAGASAWVPVSIVTNLVRSICALKDVGFWVYGADAGGTPISLTDFSNNIVLVMGSEGTGISRLLKEQCDSIISIPTHGKIDSLNVSVAAGILMYEITSKNMNEIEK